MKCFLYIHVYLYLYNSDYDKKWKCILEKQDLQRSAHLKMTTIQPIGPMPRRKVVTILRALVIPIAVN